MIIIALAIIAVLTLALIVSVALIAHDLSVERRHLAARVSAPAARSPQLTH